MHSLPSTFLVEERRMSREITSVIVPFLLFLTGMFLVSGFALFLGGLLAR